MSDDSNRFHEIALQSSLFKGRSDWYFCYLKAEKIAHVLIVLAQKSTRGESVAFIDLIEKASMLPQTIVHFVGEERAAPAVLADLFGMLSALRLATTRGLISESNSAILQGEYEQLARKIAESNRLSPFLNQQHFSVPELPPEEAFFTPALMSPAPGAPSQLPASVKDKLKGHSKGQGQNGQEASERAQRVLEVVKKNNGVSIGQIASVVRGVSEKTIQRELVALIERKLVRKEGERRWSLYYPA